MQTVTATAFTLTSSRSDYLIWSQIVGGFGPFWDKDAVLGRCAGTLQGVLSSITLLNFSGR